MLPRKEPDVTRRVRTPEGAKFYGLPIGSPIVDGPNLPSARSLTGMKRKSNQGGRPDIKDARAARAVSAAKAGKAARDAKAGEGKHRVPTREEILAKPYRSGSDGSAGRRRLPAGRRSPDVKPAGWGEEQQKKRDQVAREEAYARRDDKMEFDHVVDFINETGPDDDPDVMDWIKASSLSAKSKKELIDYMKQHRKSLRD